MSNPNPTPATPFLAAFRLIGLALALGLYATSLSGCGSGQKTPEIKILWAEWRPSDALAELGAQYKDKTGVSVQVVKKSWNGAFADAAFSEFRNRDDNYDIIIGDSQWMGLGVVGGHYLELTDWLKTNVRTEELEPAALKWYCEYPKGGARYYAVPCEADAMAWAYRKDLFEDPAHRTGFARFLAANKAEDFPLEPPRTWDQLAWIARYFKQAIPGMAGLVMPTSRNYDIATMSFEPVMWSHGGDFGDYATNRVTIDSPPTVQALRFYADLLQSTSPGGRNMGYGEVSAEFIAGRAAMACNFMAFFPAIANPGNNPDFHDKTGYFNSPGHTGADGVFHRAVALGGQGMSVNAHISRERQDRALAFLKWFSETGTQEQWAAKGGFPSNKSVLASSAFNQAAPYNRLFQEAFQLMRDFWSVPEYDDMMKSCQREICAVFQDGAEPAQAARQIQIEHEAILRKRGRIQ